MPASATGHNGTRDDEAGATGASAMPFGALRRFTRGRQAARMAIERCEFCRAVLAAEHRHLLELASRTLVCACDACAVLFSDPGAGGEKYRLVPRRYLALADFQMTDEQWDALMIPVGMAFLLRSTGPKRVMAFYPSPAGPMESLLDLEGWEALAASNPILNDLEPDVEALLIDRTRNTRAYYIVPVDACYQLVGLIRISWRGLSGGETAWKAIGEFFADLQARSSKQNQDDRGT
jgi:hypothetical protein